MITVLWSMAAAAALTLGLVYALAWLYDRRAPANLAFSFLALALACMAPIELRMMHAATPQEYGTWVRWFQVPIFMAITGVILFVRLYLRTGKAWLGWTIIAMRCVVLLPNFLSHPNLNFRQIISLEQVSLLGEQVSTVGQAVVGSWQWVATLSSFLLAVFVIDAAVELWRSGEPESRRKAVIVGGGITAFVVLSVGQTQLVIWGLAHIPALVTPPFLITLGVMAAELSHNMLRATQLARDLRDSEQRLDLAASAAGLGIWVWDIARGTLQATAKARALYGFQEGEVANIEKWIDPIDQDQLPALRWDFERAVKSGEEFVAEYRIRLPDGTVRWIAARGRSELGRAGKPVVMRGVVRDITDQKRAQDESEELRRELAHAGRVTQLGQLASALAHELNQPLGAILRNAEAAEMLLQAPVADLDELRAIVADIRKDDRRAGDVIDRLRALLRRRSLELQPLAVQELVEDTIALARYDSTARHVALDFVTTPGLPRVRGDKVHLSQVLLNLIINGMDSICETKEGRRRVVIEARRGGGQGMVELAVTDSGPGIPPELAARVFDPFFTTKSSGMGMGLPVSRTIIEAHGGKLWAENKAGQGATFCFTVPVAEGSA